MITITIVRTTMLRTRPTVRREIVDTATFADPETARLWLKRQPDDAGVKIVDRRSVAVVYGD